MAKKFLKDRWIKDAISRRYIIPREDGTILRCTRADPVTGFPLSEDYREIVVQVHKKSGRVYFNMTYRGFTKSLLVNRVIALAFLPNPFNLPQVNHIDGNKENNALRNPDGTMQLEWSSGSDNEKHAHRTGLKSGRGSSNANAKLAPHQVLEIRSSIDPVDVLMRRYGVSRSTLNNILKRKTWTHI
ncbi:hypothetical protein [Ancylobacter rudongensis]|uniref:HNH endonuclease n=1 Tax=Ancylobacter rudongensis TaxID=177413 RepID=A0A1G4UQZ7_9HYPH|nr:hypothetical protein [Ancylobacter rudongensis]SCW95954.1 hypothetical protein SAMN05660859_0157 [Ancylobacter rudongensis]